MEQEAMRSPLRKPVSETVGGKSVGGKDSRRGPGGPLRAQSPDERRGDMVKPKVYADFHNADAYGRLRLNCVGTIEDLARQGITLRDGMPLTLYSDDLDAKGQPDELLVDGVVSFSEEEHCWVAVIDWSAIHHASE